MIDLRSLARLAATYADDLDHDVAPLQIGDRSIDTDTEPALMGVINLSRDSTYRTSISTTHESAIRRGRTLTAQGAHCVDLGAESTLPTSARVDADEQNSRVVPVIEALSAEGIAVSIESYETETVRAGLRAGARLVNLTGSVDDDAMFDLAAEYDATVVLCHVYGGHARALDTTEVEADPVPMMLDQFAVRVENARTRGVRHLTIDPGIGFQFRQLTDPVNRIRHQGQVLINSFRLRRLGLPICHALPHAIDLFEEEMLQGEGFFAVLASLGGTGMYRTHEVPQVAAVLRSMHTLAVD
ncbi:dihydropteroate synthase [Nocardioides salsibiostraticola]